MSAVKFDKGSKEWQMFVDFWNICQKYWEVESNDTYWQDLIDESEEFADKYKDIELSRKLVLSFIESQELKTKR